MENIQSHCSMKVFSNQLKAHFHASLFSVAGLFRMQCFPPSWTIIMHSGRTAWSWAVPSSIRWWRSSLPRPTNPWGSRTPLPPLPTSSSVSTPRKSFNTSDPDLMAQARHVSGDSDWKACVTVNRSSKQRAVDTLGCGLLDICCAFTWLMVSDPPEGLWPCSHDCCLSPLRPFPWGQSRTSSSPQLERQQAVCALPEVWWWKYQCKSTRSIYQKVSKGLKWADFS